MTMIEFPGVVEHFISNMPLERRDDARRLVQNQLSFFKSCAEADLSDLSTCWGHNGALTWLDTFEKWGDNWVLHFLMAEITELQGLPLYDMIQFSVSESVIHATSFSQPRYGGTPEKPEVSIISQNVELKMQTRKMKWMHSLGDDFHSDDIWTEAMPLAFQEYQRAVLGDLFCAGQSMTIVPVTKDNLVETLKDQSAVFHRRTMAGPAN